MHRSVVDRLLTTNGGNTPLNLVPPRHGDGQDLPGVLEDRRVPGPVVVGKELQRYGETIERPCPLPQQAEVAGLGGAAEILGQAGLEEDLEVPPLHAVVG